MKEIQLRRKICALKLKPNTKLVLIGITFFVDWDSWSGPVSAKDVSKAMNIGESSVRRAFKELQELKLISRKAQIRQSANGKELHHRASTVLNISEINKSTTPPVNMEPPPPYQYELTKEPPVRMEPPPPVRMEPPPPVRVSYNNNKGLQQRITIEEDQQITEAQAEVIEELRASGMSEEVIARALKASKNLDKKLQYRRRQEARSTRVETSYNAYKPF